MILDTQRVLAQGAVGFPSCALSTSCTCQPRKDGTCLKEGPASGHLEQAASLEQAFEVESR